MRGRLTLYCNGEEVYRGEIANGYTPDNYRITVKLHEGTNHLLVKLRQEVPEWLFSCTSRGPRSPRANTNTPLNNASPR